MRPYTLTTRYETFGHTCRCTAGSELGLDQIAAHRPNSLPIMLSQEIPLRTSPLHFDHEYLAIRFQINGAVLTSDLVKIGVIYGHIGALVGTESFPSKFSLVLTHKTYGRFRALPSRQSSTYWS